MRNMNSIRLNGCYITIQVWELYYAKIVSFVIGCGKKLTIGVKFEVIVMIGGRGTCFLYLKFFVVYYWNFVRKV